MLDARTRTHASTYHKYMYDIDMFVGSAFCFRQNSENHFAFSSVIDLPIWLKSKEDFEDFYHYSKLATFMG